MILDFCTKCAWNISYIKKKWPYIIINPNMPSRKLRHLLVRVERNWNFQQTLRHNKIPNCMSLRHVFLRDVPLEKREMVAANTQHFQFYERAFWVIRSPTVFSTDLAWKYFWIKKRQTLCKSLTNNYSYIIQLLQYTIWYALFRVL